MANSLLSVLLVMTQLLSWSGPSLWLCICDSGETCIVADPQTCICCQRQHPAGTPCRVASCHDDVPGASDEYCSTGDRLQVGQSSGCPHFQLSHHQDIAAASAKLAADTARVTPFFAEVTDPASVVGLSVLDEATSVAWLSRPPHSLLTDRACVVLRC